MKKAHIFIIFVAILLAGAGFTSVYFLNLVKTGNDNIEQPSAETASRFYLSDESYTGAKLQELTPAEYEAKLAAGESFVVIAHAEVCPTETPLTTTAENLIQRTGMTFYGLKSDNFKESSLAQTIKYLPSAAIVQQGRVLQFLDAESDADIPYYQNADQFQSWLKQYIFLTKE